MHIYRLQLHTIGLGAILQYSAHAHCSLTTRQCRSTSYGCFFHVWQRLLYIVKRRREVVAKMRLCSIVASCPLFREMKTKANGTNTPVLRMNEEL
jgi:hypothetical protein